MHCLHLKVIIKIFASGYYSKNLSNCKSSLADENTKIIFEKDSKITSADEKHAHSLSNTNKSMQRRVFRVRDKCLLGWTWSPGGDNDVATTSQHVNVNAAR